MDRKISYGRKLSTDMQRKLSAISNCSDVSNLSLKLGMDPVDFRVTVQNILELDVDDGWEAGNSEDESGMSCYGDEDIKAGPGSRKNSEVVTIQPDQRKSSTGSTASTDSLDEAEHFEPVNIDVSSLKSVLNRYDKHRKISMSKLNQPKK